MFLDIFSKLMDRDILLRDILTLLLLRNKHNTSKSSLYFRKSRDYTWVSLIAQLVKSLMQCRRPRFNSWVGKICWKRDRLPSPVFLGFPCYSAGKESACNMGDLGSIPGLGRSPGEGKGYPLQYSGLENYIDCIVHGIANSQTQLSDLHRLHLEPLPLYIYRIKFPNESQS